MTTTLFPPDHYRAGRIGTVDLAVVHTSEVLVSAAQLARSMATGSRQVSCHSIVDDRQRLDVLPFTDTAYAAPGANADGDQLELVGLSRWTRTDWLAHMATLDRAGAWLAERCVARRLPAVLLDAADLRANGRGITGHAQVSAAFHRSSHTDPGPGFPWDVVLRRTKAHLAQLQRPAPVRATVMLPPYPGYPLHAGSRGTAVLLWQRQMRRRGWTIGVDGIYGPQSVQVARAFQRDKRLHVDGIVGPATWTASWRAPVT